MFSLLGNQARLHQGVRLKILVSDEISSKGLQMLKDSGYQVGENYQLTPEQLKDTISQYDAIIVRSRTKVTKEIIDASNLKVIARAGVGLDNIDVKAASEHGIKVLSTPQAPSVSVAELVFGLILALLREIPYADSALKQGRWVKKELVGRELRGKTLGVAGFGRIGREVAKRAIAFEAEVQAYDVIDISSSAGELGVRVTPTLEELLKTSDVITLHLPLLPDTRHLLNAERLALMKSTAFLINTSRGGVIDEVALLEALKSEKIAGVALDVFEVEPPTDLELVKLRNVVCTPHIGAQTVEAQDASGLEIVQSVLEELRKLS
jgi:D-3-phosphoglycerate dehydrogenase / 2-oxoglutarate reductase